MTFLADPELVERRKAIAAMAAAPLARGTTVTPVEQVDFSALLIEPPTTGTHQTLVHLHGGGFRLGSAAAWTPFLSHLAHNTNTRILNVDYPLAPEHPYPAAFAAARAAAVWASQSMGAFVLSGDSAGGGLAAAVALTLSEPVRALHSGTILLSPWLDLRIVNESFDECGPLDELFSARAARDAIDAYCPGLDVTEKTLSPGLGDWHGQPPIFIETSSTEVLRDDARQLAARALSSGVRVWFRELSDQPHDWHITKEPDSAVVKSSLSAVEEFLSMATQRHASAGIGS
ncbi:MULTISPECIES: alpha/beta hydrolase fold domain-containing protein [Rhodococcus]|uniref:Alpha/beta hydrolase fold domain-containing protein n=1 Tax=Rhodococcus oxybenzonivorans TaxID=1990687 RepID=A0AAE4V0L3_9NOCA|nr:MULTISPECIES: alpha/beta hydrolase fold domain-containing protein [Rhodococcus]MDV7240566.1 alpha/beta hydrolase fold domain-containing protein [Rhodococcus oxybenzonivorans]MDV7265739.1 alpha/beta hydrolase fold domain-containing protein [Rhodococcus oxybenzonivorans]MDV7272839.1 alpha/beta hydrolase fold domain-containing protein [Rhodococcus oxybenzonivorans]MDV7333422.1 alpha/beta hydrolase fold domain-containing protein [Rhodococcus oxybenzonivorans]MDV7342589.1 alpha/beta hydrolase fo